MSRPIRCLLSISMLLCLFSSMSTAQGLGVTGDLITNLDGSRVLLVRNVIGQGLAHRLGILPGDTILSINNFAPGDALINQQAIAAGGGRLAVLVNRQGVPLRLGDRVGQYYVPGSFGPAVPYDPRVPDGTRIPGTAIDRHQARRPAGRPGPNLLVDLDEKQDIGGTRVVVRSVNPAGRGAQEGFKQGDIIDSVNAVKIRSLRDVRDAYYFRNGQIVITIVRGAGVQQITLQDKDTTRRTLGLTCIMTQQRQIKVTGSNPQGLGREIGIAERGTVISKVNGTAIRTPADMKRVDQAIIEGRITQLEIEFIPPGGQPQIVRRAL